MRGSITSPYQPIRPVWHGVRNRAGSVTHSKALCGDASSYQSQVPEQGHGRVGYGDVLYVTGECRWLAGAVSEVRGGAGLGAVPQPEEPRDGADRRGRGADRDLP